MKKQLTVGSLKDQSRPDRPATPVPLPSAAAAPPARIGLRQQERDFFVPAESGQTLLDAALACGIPLAYKCRKGSCGMCAVEVTKWGDRLGPAAHTERKQLGKQLLAGYRLACQAVIR